MKKLFFPTNSSLGTNTYIPMSNRNRLLGLASLSYYSHFSVLSKYIIFPREDTSEPWQLDEWKCNKADLSSLTVSGELDFVTFILRIGLNRKSNCIDLTLSTCAHTAVLPQQAAHYSNPHMVRLWEVTVSTRMCQLENQTHFSLPLAGFYWHFDYRVSEQLQHWVHRVWRRWWFI